MRAVAVEIGDLNRVSQGGSARVAMVDTEGARRGVWGSLCRAGSECCCETARQARSVYLRPSWRVRGGGVVSLKVRWMHGGRARELVAERLEPFGERILLLFFSGLPCFPPPPH